MNSVQTTALRRRKTAPRDWNRLSTIFSFSFAVVALTLLVEKSHCFVPSSVTFPTNNHRAAEISFVRLRLTEIETNKNNNEVEFGEKYNNPYSNQEIKKSKQKEFADVAAAIDTAVAETTNKYSIQPFNGIETHQFPTKAIESPRSEKRLKRNEKLATSRPVRNKSNSSSMHRNMTTVINDLGDSWSKTRLFRDLRSELRFETKKVYNKKSSGKKSFENLKPYNNGVDYDDDNNNLPRRNSLEESCRAMIESTVEDMMKSSTGSRTMGLFGEATRSEAAYYNYIPKAGTILARSSEKSPSSKNKKSSSSDNTIIRMASHMDDIDIANLRLSVFSSFTPESLKIFCDRSCQLLSTRRQRGANCIVATNSKNKKDGKGPVIGTAEISLHEFTETGLGYTRPKNSILYITEVAVDATHRRKGVAKLMLEAIDNVANIRDVETIYLHVDVTNVGAVRLYEAAGYKILAPDNPIFSEFTKKLNLHDGATKGRNHHLLAKDLRRPTWLNYQDWLDYQENRLNYEEPIDEAHTVSPKSGVLGIEVPVI
jgi:ribosomal protein S18 acetylase RimI-like enzyme